MLLLAQLCVISAPRGWGCQHLAPHELPAGEARLVVSALAADAAPQVLLAGTPTGTLIRFTVERSAA